MRSYGRDVLENQILREPFYIWFQADLSHVLHEQVQQNVLEGYAFLHQVDTRKFVDDYLGVVVQVYELQSSVF